MSAISEEIQRLQLKIVELENKEKEENNEKISIEHNFNVIDDLITDKFYNKNKTQLVRPKLTTEMKSAKNVQLCVVHLEAIYNILQILDKRLIKIEEKNA